MNYRSGILGKGEDVKHGPESATKRTRKGFPRGTAEENGTRRDAISPVAKEESRMKCVACRGTGEESPGYWRTEKCEECGGTGRVSEKA